MHSN